MSVETPFQVFQEAALNRRWIIRSAVKTAINRASVTLHSYKLPLLCRCYCCSCSNSSGNDYRYACLIAGCHLRLIASTVIVAIDRHTTRGSGALVAASSSCLSIYFRQMHYPCAIFLSQLDDLRTFISQLSFRLGLYATILFSQARIEFFFRTTYNYLWSLE